MSASEQKCTFKGCNHRGIPSKGFDFYACEECLDELERLIAIGLLEKEVKRHEQN